MASSSNQDIEKGSPPNSSGSENGFLDILAAQESFFTQIDSIMAALGTKETNAEGLVTLEPKYIKTLQDIVGNMKEFFLLFQTKAIDEISILEQALKDSKDREMEWRSLSDLFSQYRSKVGAEMSSMKSVIEGYGTVKEELQAQLKEKEATIAKMQDEMVVQQDLLIRVQAATKRRANLMVLEADIGEEEASIVKSIARLRAAAAAVQAVDD